MVVTYGIIVMLTSRDFIHDCANAQDRGEVGYDVNVRIKHKCTGTWLHLNKG